MRLKVTFRLVDQKDITFKDVYFFKTKNLNSDNPADDRSRNSNCINYAWEAFTTHD